MFVYFGASLRWFDPYRSACVYQNLTIGGGRSPNGDNRRRRTLYANGIVAVWQLNGYQFAPCVDYYLLGPGTEPKLNLARFCGNFNLACCQPSAKYGPVLSVDSQLAFHRAHRHVARSQ